MCAHISAALREMRIILSLRTTLALCTGITKPAPSTMRLYTLPCLPGF